MPREQKQRRGLSPRVRGNPHSGVVAMPNRKVYPRVCGGTLVMPREQKQRRGLSPRVRGNRGKEPGGPGRRRSIPACAGEPSARTRWCCTGRVYPRVCGGTAYAITRQSSGSGLSPRVRGNLRDPAASVPQPGSIPACAGEPAFVAQLSDPEKVYPRVCGGTTMSFISDLVDTGLSPRVRGNPRAST